MPDSRDVYKVRIYYKGQSGPFKSRPVLVLNDLYIGWYTISEITLVSPKEPPSYYDQFKEVITKLDECGLDQPSYVKCRNIHNIEGSRQYQQIGIMNFDDFVRIIDKIDAPN